MFYIDISYLHHSPSPQEDFTYKFLLLKPSVHIIEIIVFIL